jgi:hypothetical protein
MSHPSDPIDFLSSPEPTPIQTNLELRRTRTRPLGLTPGEQTILRSKIGKGGKSGKEGIGGEGSDQGKSAVPVESRESQWKPSALLRAKEGKENKSIPSESAVRITEITQSDSSRPDLNEITESEPGNSLESPSTSPLDQANGTLSMNGLNINTLNTATSLHSEIKRPRALDRDKLAIAYSKSSVIRDTSSTSSKTQLVDAVDQQAISSSSSGIKRKAASDDSVTSAPPPVQPKKRKSNLSPYCIGSNSHTVSQKDKIVPAPIVDIVSHRNLMIDDLADRVESIPFRLPYGFRYRPQ